MTRTTQAARPSLPARLRRSRSLSLLLLPLVGAARAVAAPPAVVQSDTPPPAVGGQAPEPGQAAGWIARGVAELRALDKISARVTPLTVRVGGSGTVGSLTVTVRGCLIRPPDQPADAAAFLDITDTRGGAAAFRGWMFANEPAVAVLENPVYDVRVVGCHA